LASFTKLFSTITESTVWSESNATRIVWITMLASADSMGRVLAAVPGLAHKARVSIEECEAALTRFRAPDPYSRTRDFDGRRIEDIDGGWRLLNYAKYRGLRDEEARRDYQREWDRVHRSKGARDAAANLPPAVPPPDPPPVVPLDPADTPPVVPAGGNGKHSEPPVELPDWLDASLFGKWWLTRKPKARTPDAKREALKKLERWRAAGHDANAIVSDSLANGWSGLFEPDRFGKRGQSATPFVPGQSDAARRFIEAGAKK
jgi:hypothetical protein